MTQNLEEITENFGLFDDWEERYRYLIDLGRSLPALAADRRVDEALVKGCTSQVWLYAERGADGRFTFEADSDAHIVRGLVAILLLAYNGKNAAEIAAVDIDGFFESVGLSSHLSPNRRNGFFAMVEKVKAFAG